MRISTIAAVATNGAQERLHAALHVLSSCRKLLHLLPLSAQADGRFAPRLTLLRSLLSLLQPPPPPAPAAAQHAIAPAVASASLSLLRSLGPYWRTHTSTQIEIVDACVRVLVPPSTLPPTARTSTYLVLSSLLR